MDEAEANRVQTEWCKAEVQRIHAAGERYLNAKLIGADSGPSADDVAAIAPYAGSVTKNIRLLLQDGKSRTAREIATDLQQPVECIYTAVARLRQDGWIDTIDGPHGQKRYQCATVDSDEPRGVMGWYRRLLSDAKEHCVDELLRLGGTRDDLPRRIWELRSGGMNIVTVRYPGKITAYQWRP